jgi:putative Mg2+ transporter-C (MgtC) family protein
VTDLPPPAIGYLDITLRLLMALACGTVIGLNREFHRKPAGFRTFGLVAIGSAVVVIVMELEYGTGADAVSRVIQGVLTGIGFLGAGVIFRRDSPSKVAGLTTAAAVWLTAGLGMAAGAGQYAVAAGGMTLGIVLLLLGGPFEKLLTRRMRKAAGKPVHPDPKDDAPESRPPQEPKDRP